MSSCDYHKRNEIEAMAMLKGNSIENLYDEETNNKVASELKTYYHNIEDDEELLSQDEKIALGSLTIKEQNEYISNKKNNKEKLYLVEITIKSGNFEGTECLSTRSYEKLFYSLEDASSYAKNPLDLTLDRVTDHFDSKIYEYIVYSKRELAKKTRPIEVVTRSETYWE